jgi:hypothetical protein
VTVVLVLLVLRSLLRFTDESLFIVCPRISSRRELPRL